MSSQPANIGYTCDGGIEFEFPKGYKPGDFLYKEDGPWPSKPSRDNPCSIAPEVLSNDKKKNEHFPNRIPQEEIDCWQEKLGDYLVCNADNFTSSAIDYSSDLLGVSLSSSDKFGITLLIGAWALSGQRTDFEGGGDYPGQYPALSDATFTDLIAHGLLSKLLSRLDLPDETIFKSFLNDKTREFWKCDLTHMRVVRQTWKGEYVAPAIVLLSRPKSPASGQEYDFQLDCIALFVQSGAGGPYDKNVILVPGDGKAWQLAKYFALQGALVRINLIDHTMVHFPCDAINAITKSALPMSNRVFQLLLPHLFLGLPVDNAVLKGPNSLLNRTSTYPYSPYPAGGPEIRKVFPFYWLGSGPIEDSAEPWASDRDNGFPAYRFHTEPRELPSKYGTFLNAYYKPILDFATGVVASIPADGRDWEEICRWADAIASWIPSFPDGKTINRNSELLAKTCASIIWNGAIVHTADHWLMHEMFENKLPTPYIMRDQPPESASPGVEPDYRPTVRLINDVIPARLCDLMFFQPHNTTLLIDFEYKFSTNLDTLVAKFRNDLIATDATLHKQFPEFGIKLKGKDKAEDDNGCFAASVQF